MDEKKKSVASVEPSVQLAALAGKVAGLEEKDALREKKDALAALAAKYEGELKGWHLSDSVKKTILLMAEKGEDAIKAFVDSYKTTVPRETPRTFADFEGAVGFPAAGDPEIDKVLQLYQSRGPEALEQARKFVRLHADAKASGLTRLSAENFVSAQFMGLKADLQVNGVVH